MRILLTDPLIRCRLAQALPACGDVSLAGTAARRRFRRPSCLAAAGRDGQPAAKRYAGLLFRAGADHLLSDGRIPLDVPIVRLVDEEQASQIADYAAHVAFARLLDDSGRRQDQRDALWRLPLAPRRRRSDMKITVLGLGPIGERVVGELAEIGFKVSVWTRRPRQAGRFEIHSGHHGLKNAASGADVLINLLPLTPATANVLAAPLFSVLAPGAYLANLGRGGHLEEGDLLDCLRSGRMGAAWLDVFREEPLPVSHPFWGDPRICVTPHIGGLPTAGGAARSLANAIDALEHGRPLPHVVHSPRQDGPAPATNSPEK